MDCCYIGGWIPYGFRVDPQTRRYIINEYEAEAVRMIFRDVADGCGYNVVLNKLNALGYRTRLGNTFSKETLYEIPRYSWKRLCCSADRCGADCFCQSAEL